MKQIILRRERQEGKTTYSHFQFGIMKASEVSLRNLLGKDYEGARKIYHKLNKRIS